MSEHAYDVKKILYKTRLKENKENWLNLPLSAIPQKIQSIDRKAYREGRCNIYLNPFLYPENNPKTPKGIWLNFDVEHPDGKGHKDIQKNIDAAQTVHEILAENNLLAGLKISLTGNGFRFAFPEYLPIEKKELLNEFLKDVPEIDGAVFHKKTFIRVAGYRGHIFQSVSEKNIMPVHVHYLDGSSPDILHGLTPDEYMDMVKGPSQFSDLQNIPSLLPNQEMNAAWHEFLEKYQRKISLRKTVFSGYEFRKSGGISIETVESAVSSAGFETGKIIDSDAGVFIRMKKCPLCSRTGAWVTASGRLKCFHTSCQAGAEQNEHGKPAGLSAKDWCPQLAEHVQEEDTFQTTDNAEAKAVQDIRDTLKTALTGKDDFLAKITCGAGKSHTTLETVLPLCRDKHFLWAVPSGRLRDETFALANSMSAGVNVRKLEGRNYKNCDKIHKVNYETGRGYPPAITVCSACKYKKEKNCVYYSQFKDMEKPGLSIVAHAHLKYLDFNEMDISCTVIDEKCTDTFFVKESIRQDRIDSFKGTETVREFYRKLYETVDEIRKEQKDMFLSGKKQHARIYSGQGPSGSQWETQQDIIKLAGIAQEDLKALEERISPYQRFADENLYQYYQRCKKENIDLKALQWLENFLKRDGSAYILIKPGDQKNPVKFNTFYKKTPDFSDIRIIHLDATGYKPELDSVFSRNFKEIACRAELPNCHKVWIRQATGKMAVNHMDSSKLKKLIQDGIRHLSPKDRNVLILTHKCRKEEILSMAKQLLPDRTVEATHFGEGRGLNAWKNFNAVICLGWLNVNPVSAMDAAMNLFPDKEAQQKYLSELGRAEVFQGVSRIRPVFGNKTIIMISRNWLPELGRPDVQIDLRRGVKGETVHENLSTAYERCRAWVSEFGWINSQIPEILGICTYGNEVMTRQLADNILKIFGLASIQDVKTENTKYLQDVKCKNTACEKKQESVFCLIKNISIRQKTLFEKKTNAGKTAENTCNSDCYHDFSGMMNANRFNFNRLSGIVSFYGGNNVWWSNILCMLKKEFPDLPDLESAGPGGWSKGLGYLSSVRNTYQAIGMAEFEPDAWRGMYTDVMADQEAEKEKPDMRKPERKAKSVLIEMTEIETDKQHSPCFACKGTVFWKKACGNWECMVCHPFAN